MVSKRRENSPSLLRLELSLESDLADYLAAVMLFTLLYYRSFGLIANVALMANLVLISGCA